MTRFSRQLPAIVIEKFPDQWASIVRFAFFEPRGRALIQLDRFGDKRSIHARPYAPLKTARGIVPAGWINPGDHIYLDGNIGDTIQTASWQVTDVDINWEGEGK